MTPVLITGFHRSGTSAVARILHSASLDFGDNLLGADPSNPHGHFEDLDVIDAHDAALARCGLTWKSPTTCPSPRPELGEFIATFAANRSRTGQPWAIKDPRLCLFASDWLEHLPDAKVIVVLRRPGPAIDSLHRRHVRRYVDTRQIDPTDLAFWQQPDLALALWTHYYDQVLALTRSGLFSESNMIVADFDNRESLNDLPALCNARWGLGLSATATDAVDPALGVDIDSVQSIEVRDRELITRAGHVWTALSSR